MIRINRYISASGFTSRRGADQLIDEGRVKVNGSVLREKGILIDPIKDQVEIDDQSIVSDMSKAWIAFYKPRGVLSSMTGEKSLVQFIDSMPHKGLFHVGRLDRESEGLLVLTNDGDFAQNLIHPKYQVEKEYLVSLDTDITKEFVSTLRGGLSLDDGPFKPLHVVKTGPNRVLLVISDGRNRVIRRAMAELGFNVTRLLRTRIGKIELGHLREGEWRYLKKHEKTSR